MKCSEVKFKCFCAFSCLKAQKQTFKCWDTSWTQKWSTSVVTKTELPQCTLFYEGQRPVYKRDFLFSIENLIHTTHLLLVWIYVYIYKEWTVSCLKIVFYTENAYWLITLFIYPFNIKATQSSRPFPLPPIVWHKELDCRKYCSSDEEV